MTVVESAQRFGAATRKRRVLRWAVAALVVLLAAGVVWAVWFSTWFSVSEVRVLGARTVSIDEVRQAAAVPAHQPLARVDVDGITARVSAIPEVASVEVRRGWPDVLVIVVTERTPVAVMRSGSGFTYLDATGVRFGDPAGAQGLPVVTARSDPARATAAAVVSALPPTLAEQVATVVARSRDDVVLHLAGGATVQWGSAEDSARKAEVLAALLHVKARSYDVSAPDLPTTRGTSASASAG
ncbi:MAG: FtsQ-type POTRA domain-containing protein [Frankiales bacterium]|nr:FtsQ-type POTRA domain-containing protein [Frankiales bacterium]